MGHRKKSAPRRGSLGVRPRKRAASIIPRVRSWPTFISEQPILLGFLGYKVGMTHVIMIDDRPGSPTEGKEIFVPVTFVETPPLVGLAVRLYKRDPNQGLQSLGEVWLGKDRLNAIEELHLERAIKSINIPHTTDDSLAKLDKLSKNADEARLIVASRPYLAGGLSQKKPIIVEVAIAGKDVAKKIEYAAGLLGENIPVTHVFNPGMFIDVIGVTKGKGFQGVIKRFGVKELPRWHKHRKASRTVGSRGSRVGALSSTPQAGQMGYHQRTEYNKRILYLGGLPEDGAEEILKNINPQGGWHKYGLIKSDFAIISGSLQGTTKRPLFLRYPIRKTPWQPEGPPKIIFSHRVDLPKILVK